MINPLHIMQLTQYEDLRTLRFDILPILIDTFRMALHLFKMSIPYLGLSIIATTRLKEYFFHNMKRPVLIILTMLLAVLVQAQKTDTIRVGYQFGQFKNLELGTVTDLVYNEANGRLNIAIKKRTTELVNINGKEFVKIVHEWNSPNEQWSGYFEYYCEPGTLKPVQHVRNTKLNGKEAFSFQDLTVTGLDSAKENSKTDFSLELSEPTYNWEVDLETYSLLPMKKGYEVVMNFYHPGGSAPGFYHLKITGSEKLKLPNGKMLDCWILFTDYGGSQPTRFWYTKKGQNFVKMEATYNTLKIRKVRLF